MFAEMNKQSTVREGLDTEGFEYHKLSEFVKKTVKPVGVFFTQSTKGYGKQAVIVTEDCFVNMPNWSVPLFESIANDPEKITAFKDGKCLITNIATKDTGKGNPTTVFELADA